MDIGSLFLGGLFVGCFTSGTHLLHELSILVGVVLVIFRDQYLSSYLGLVLYACFGFLFTCHLLILSKAVVLRPKSSVAGRSPKQLRDTDLEFESPVNFSCRRICIREFLKNCCELCKFRPVYGIIAVVGCIFLVIFCVLRTLPVEDLKLRVDLHSASLGFLVPGLILLLIPLVIANVGVYDIDDESDVYSYRPFQDIVKVPFKVVAGKTLAAFLTGPCMNIIFTLLLLGFVLLVFCLLVFVYYMAETDFAKIQTEYGKRLILFKNVRTLLVTLLTSTIVFGISLLSNRIALSWHKARRSVLGVIEKNFRRNLRAIEYLLQDVEVASLEELEAALDAKRTEQLTDEEKRAFNYVDWPLWQTKRPFVGKSVIVEEQVVLPDSEVTEPPEQRIVEPNILPEDRPFVDAMEPLQVTPERTDKDYIGGDLGVDVNILSPIRKGQEENSQAEVSSETPAPVVESKEPRRSIRIKLLRKEGP